MLGNQSEQSGFQLFNRKTAVAAHVTSRCLGDHDPYERRLKGLEDRRNSRQLILQPGEGFQDILKAGGFRQGLNDGGVSAVSDALPVRLPSFVTGASSLVPGSEMP